MSKKAPFLREEMNYKCFYIPHYIYSGMKLPLEKVVLLNLEYRIDPEGLPYQVGNIPIPQSVQRNGIRMHPDCM